jgi:hypothetical protein
MTTQSSNAGTYNFTGFGHQVRSEVKKMEAVKTTLEEAMSLLGVPNNHPELSGFISRAIEEAQGLIISADEAINQND